jgi:hypothetical protein
MRDVEEQMMIQRARTHLSDVVLYMPVATKAAYLEALVQCPHLVESESNPETFLRFENFNYWSAAGRLVTYWRKRKEYFGDRAFLPMDLSGEGAMNEEDLRPMAAGCITMIPNSNIIIHDRTCASDAGDEATKLRRRFFFMQTLMDPCFRGGKGTRLFIYGFEISDMRRRMNTEAKLLFEDAFPIPNMEAVHLVFVKEKSQTLWQYLLPLGLEQMSGLISHLKVHNFDSVEEIAEGLSGYGVTRSHLPPKLGGHYSVEFSSFVLAHRLPLSTANRIQKKLFLNSLGEKEEDSINSRDVHRATQRGSEGKGSLELLLDYFMKRAPDLPDVAEADSLNPLRPFPSSPTHDSWQHQDELANEILSHDITACQGLSVPMYHDSDAKSLSKYQCLVRQQIEFFESTEDDVSSCIRGRNRLIVLGQVGIRCRHCAHLPRQNRAMAATYYPTTLEGVYQTAQNLARKHLIGTCPHVPLDCRQRLTELCESKSALGTGKRYWAEKAQMSGVFEDDSILRFR